MNIDLDQIKTDLAKLSDALASELFVNPETEKPVARPTLAGWRKNASAMPAWAIAKIAKNVGSCACGSSVDTTPKQSDPGFAQIDPKWAAGVDGWGDAKMCIGFPTSGHSTHTKTVFCLMALQALHTKKVSFIPCENNPIGRSRNIIATQFLARPEKPAWLLFIDNDMVVPFGSGPWADEIWKKLGGVPNEFAKMDICSRLASHGKQLVGALYVGRGPTGVAQFAEAYENQSINRIAHSGPKDELKPTKWVATGAMLIHRDVFLKIAEKFPDLRPLHPDDPYRFFAMEDDEGEDMLFCKRAREAGIQPYVDMGCHCGHEGNFIFWPHNTTPVPPKRGEFLDAKSRIAANSVRENPTLVQGNGHVDTTAKVLSADVVQAQRQAQPTAYVSPPIATGIAGMARPMPDVTKPPISNATIQAGAPTPVEVVPTLGKIPAAMPAPSPQLAMAPSGPPGLIFGGG